MNILSERPRILIVDDQPDNIDLLTNLLKDSYTLMAVTNGERALRLAMAEQPDLILLDIMMPGLDGYEVCRRLHADPRTRKIPVIFVTAMGEAEDEARGLELGAVDYLTKPYNPLVVEARVKTHLELKAYRDRLEHLAEERAKQLVHCERLALLGTLSAGVAHEIRSPLSYILGFAELLDLEYGKYAQNKQLCPADCPFVADYSRLFQGWRQHLAAIIEGSRRITAIIDSMRTFSRREGDEQRLVDVEACLDTALSLCQNIVKRFRLAYHKPLPKLPRIMGNAQQLEQVFVNLFQNAADAMTGRAEGELVILPTLLPTALQIVIRDRGTGIPPDKLEAIWEPFYTTKDSEHGTGLGLAICKGIIESHRGTIRAANTPEGGAEFIIEIPLPAAIQRRVIGLAAGQPQYRILVVDNQLQYRMILMRRLRETGFLVQAAGNGQEGVDLVAEWHPDLVLMDMRMPVLDGWQATRAIKATPTGQKIPVVALTSCEENERQDILASGCVDFLRKPCTLDELLDLVAQYLPVKYRYAEPPAKSG